MGERFNRNVLFTCLGSPGKPVVDTVGPLLLQRGDRILLCSDGLWGNVSDADRDGAADASTDLRCGAGTRRDGAAHRRREVRQRDGARARVGVGRERRQHERRVDPGAGRRGVRLDDPGQRARAARRSDELDDAEIERSIREINDAIRRSSRTKLLRFPMTDLPAHAMAAQPMRCARSRSRATTRATPRARCSSSSATRRCCAPPRSKRRCRRTSAAAGEGWVTAEYGMLPRATHTRSDREAARASRADARRRSSA